MRTLAALLILALIAAGCGWYYYHISRVQLVAQHAQIEELNHKLEGLQAENEQLKQHLSQVQDEENRMVQANALLRKAIEQAKVTGKIAEPNLPYPPK